MLRAKEAVLYFHCAVQRQDAGLHEFDSEFETHVRLQVQQKNYDFADGVQELHRFSQLFDPSLIWEFASWQDETAPGFVRPDYE